MENVDVNFGISDSVYGVVSNAVLPNKAGEEVTKGATKLWSKAIFVSATKIGENTSNILNYCFSEWIYTLSHQSKCLHIEKQICLS